MIEFEDLDEAEPTEAGRGGGPSGRRSRWRLDGDSPSVTIRRSWLVGALAVAALLGLVVGRLSVGSSSGSADAAGRTATASRSPGTQASSPAPAQVDGQVTKASRCAAQTGKLLQVGIEVLNQTGQPAAFSLVRVRLPLNGFTVVRAGFGACSEMGGDGRDQIGVPPGGTVWLSALLRPTVRCVTPLPVQFSAQIQTGQTTTQVDLGGFADLGDVQWSGCPDQSSQFS